jgi:hypothetical protein
MHPDLIDDEVNTPHVKLHCLIAVDPPPLVGMNKVNGNVGGIFHQFFQLVGNG